jgi:predicted Mrr-cat superfamily restriction endonuclease
MMYGGKFMTVWVFNTPQGEGEVDFVYSSLQKGISRYGWSYVNTADLRKMENKEWEELDEAEARCWNRGRFLLEVEKGDWIVHINVPEWGLCTAGQVVEPYKFDPKKNSIGIDDYSDGGNFRHMLGIDTKTLITFDRNNENVTPYISRRLKLRGAHWRIYETDEFLKSLEDVRNNAVSLPENVTRGLYYLREDLKTHLAEITKAIQKNHPGKKLEEFIAMIFEKVPNVITVNQNGSGGGTDYGADIIVTYSTGLPINGLQQEAVTVIQVKSFTGTHWSDKAVEQIKTGINKYEASSGLIITTAESSDELLKSIEKAQEQIEKPIALMAGEDVAMFVLKYGAEYIF